MSLPVTHSVDSDGIGWIVFEDPAGRVNIFNPATQAALAAALTALAAAAPRAVVVRSALPRIFIAGADLHWLHSLPDAAALAQAARDGQALFARLADFPVPVVAAIHGAAAGGGCELPLACHWRVATEAKETQIGLPEVGLGLIPGWGGCVRLPRLIGAEAAVAHILKAALLGGADALKVGLVDELVPAAELFGRAKAAALRLAAEGRPVRPAPPAAPEGFWAKQRAAVAGRARFVPAPRVALEVIEQGLARPEAAAYALEAERFGEVATGAPARNLVHVFRLKERARRQTIAPWYPGARTGAGSLPPLRNIGVIGAGVMGSGIAHWCAMKGLGVLLHDADTVALKRGVEVIRGLFREAEERGRITHAAAHKAMGGIGISTSLEDFEFCDLVIEAVVENAAVKRDVFAQVARIVPPTTVLASNTSALPIDEITAGVPAPGRVLGLHFFNPVSRMPLVEFVLGPETTAETAERALQFVQALGKTAVICRSAPGFYTTRVLAVYLNEACRLWEQGVRTAAIDGAMKDWGWPMGPLRLIDEIGTDVTAFILAEMEHYYPERFTRSTLCARLLEAGLRGRKNGASSGFYTYGDGGEAASAVAAEFGPAAAVTLDAGAIQERLMGVMTAETDRTLAEGVLKTPEDADLALLLGLGFPAFRGGLRRPAAR